MLASARQWIPPTNLLLQVGAISGLLLLHLRNPGGITGSNIEQYAVFDVTTPIVTLF